jgi:fructose-1,6-bisphosphatase II
MPEVETIPEQIGAFSHELEPEKLIGLDMTRASEAASLNAFKWIGKGDHEAADNAAIDAIRGMLNLVDMCGTCTIGEGVKDQVPGIFIGERLGTWKPGSPAVSVAVDPIDGATLTAKGLPGALSVIAAAKTESVEQRTLIAPPCTYMQKIAVGPRVREGPGPVRFDVPLEQNLELVALKLGKRVRDLVVCLLDRPRHEELIQQIRATGAAIRMISDGDVAGAIAPSMPDSGVDVYVGMGGAREAVTAAVAIKCLGGEILARIWPNDEEERKALEEQGYGPAELQRTYTSEDMAQGDGIVFVATGITDNALLRGVSVSGKVARTESVVMRARSRTVRYITAYHDLTRKTIRLQSEAAEKPL